MWVGADGAMVADAYGDSLRILNPTRHAQWLKTPPKPTYARSPGAYAEWINAITGKGPAPLSNFVDYSGPLTEIWRSRPSCSSNAVTAVFSLR